MVVSSRYREYLTVSEVAIETREPTILFYLVAKNKIVAGKVIVAKAIGIYSLYIRITCFVINRPEEKGD
ncbi:hypothetical protein KSP40_PGU021668 [Platanthera guangdongensis]|uniref:Uncharacterized protein n=1 Tax=Platanthera guangdongensis TaxID=2320717 RepID=A0ABR2LYI1_9ASPA